MKKIPPEIEKLYWWPEIIAASCRLFENCIYVEIGVGRGFTFTKVAPCCTESHGIDIKPYFESWMPPGSRFWGIASDEFFRAYDGPAPNVIFIDGDHAHEQARRDFCNALELLDKGGLIFLHDTWPIDETQTEPDECGTVWKLAETLCEADSVETFTWPLYPGLTIVRRRGEGIDPTQLRETSSTLGAPGIRG